MRHGLSLVFVALVVGLSVSACSDNPKATEACKEKSGSSEDCSNCCTAHGAHGYKFVTGSPCGCLN